MGFMIRCVLCIALVYAAVQWRVAPSPASRGGAGHATARSRPEPAPALDAASRALLQSGAERLTASAREWCLSAPKDCVAMLARTQAKPR